jgi:hypothetical protein
VLPPRSDDATPLWCASPPSYSVVATAGRRVYFRPEIRGRLRTVVSRTVRHPLWAARTALRWRSVHVTAGLLLWQETAQWFGHQTVDIDGRGPWSVRPLVRRRRRRSTPRAATSAVTGLVIAQDEQPLMPRVLASLAPAVASTVVVDGGSTDATVDVARAQGATVVERRFDDDFAAQRNAGLDVVRTPWVLMLDCDEQIPEELGRLLTQIAGSAEVDAVFVPRLNLVGDDPTPTLFPDLQPRLFRAHLRYTGRVHERLTPRTAIHLPVSGPNIQHHKSPLRHYGNSLHYSDIDPGQSTPELVAWMRQEVARLHESATGDGDPPRSTS